MRSWKYSVLVRCRTWFMCIWITCLLAGSLTGWFACYLRFNAQKRVMFTIYPYKSAILAMVCVHRRSELTFVIHEMVPANYIELQYVWICVCVEKFKINGSASIYYVEMWHFFLKKKIVLGAPHVSIFVSIEKYDYAICCGFLLLHDV